MWLLWVLCIVRQWSLRRAYHSSRGVLPTVVRRCVWSRNLVNKEALAHRGVVAPKNKQTKTSNISRSVISFCYIMRYCEPNPYVTTNNTPSFLSHTKRKRWKLESTSSMSLRVCSPHRCAAYDGQAFRIATAGALYWSRVGGQPGVECLLHSSWSVNWDKQYKIHLPFPFHFPPPPVLQSAVVHWNMKSTVRTYLINQLWNVNIRTFTVRYPL